MVRLPGSTDSLTLAEYGMRNSDIPAGLVESPVPSNGHAGFGRRAEETDQSKDRHRASSRPHYESLYLQARGELRTQLKIALRQGRRLPPDVVTLTSHTTVGKDQPTTPPDQPP